MVIAVFISLFIYLVPTSPSFIRIQFKTVRFVGVISAFYKAFVGFSSRSIELILNRSPSYDELPSLSNFKLIQPKKIVAVLFFFLSFLTSSAAGGRRGLVPRNDVLTTCKAVSLLGGQRVIGVFPSIIVHCLSLYILKLLFMDRCYRYN